MGEPVYDLHSSVDLWDWEWGTRLLRIPGVCNPVFAPSGAELAVLSSALEFWSLPTHSVSASAGQAVWLPEYDSQGNARGKPTYMEDDY